MSATALASSSPITARISASGTLDPGSVEVLANLAENVLVALFLEVGLDDRPDVVLQRRARDSELGGRPLGEQLVAAGLGAELKVLIEREFLLERLLAIIERGHSILHLERRLAAPRAAGPV